MTPTHKNIIHNIEYFRLWLLIYEDRQWFPQGIYLLFAKTHSSSHPRGDMDRMLDHYWVIVCDIGLIMSHVFLVYVAAGVTEFSGEKGDTAIAVYLRKGPSTILFFILFISPWRYATQGTRGHAIRSIIQSLSIGCTFIIIFLWNE